MRQSDGYNQGHLQSQRFQTVFKRKKNRKHCLRDSACGFYLTIVFL